MAYRSKDVVVVADERGSCEPECSEFPEGAHHPCCSQAILAAEMSDMNEVLEDDITETNHVSAAGV